MCEYVKQSNPHLYSQDMTLLEKDSHYKPETVIKLS